MPLQQGRVLFDRGPIRRGAAFEHPPYERHRAENLMIVDLLHKDMIRVSEVGSVKMPELFVVERFETLHQMT